MAAFAPIDRPPDEHASEVMQIESLVEVHMHGSIVTLIEKSVELTSKLDTSVSEMSRSLPPDGPIL